MFGAHPKPNVRLPVRVKETPCLAQRPPGAGRCRWGWVSSYCRFQALKMIDRAFWQDCAGDGRRS
eukprot:6144151-Alexandrium_andersonii.AAC.1